MRFIFFRIFTEFFYQVLFVRFFMRKKEISMKIKIQTQEEYKKALKDLQILWNQKEAQAYLKTLIKEVDAYEARLWRKKSHGPSLQKIFTFYQSKSLQIPIVLEGVN